MDELTKRANNDVQGIDLNDINMEACMLIFIKLKIKDPNSIFFTFLNGFILFEALADKIVDFNADLDNPGIGMNDDTLHELHEIGKFIVVKYVFCGS